jgi:hypothetical protein
MEIVEDRHGRDSMLITSQLPVTTWYKVIGEPTLGDAILDRIAHNAYRLELDGSMRKIKASKKPIRCRRWRPSQPMPSRPREQRNETQTQYPGRPRGSTGTSRARRRVRLRSTPRRARVPPVDYGDRLFDQRQPCTIEFSPDSTFLCTNAYSELTPLKTL